MKSFSLLLVLIVLIEDSFEAICPNPQAFQNQVVADQLGGEKGQCVSFYKTCSKDYRNTPLWRRGVQVKGNKNIPVGTGIASFTSTDKLQYVGSNCNKPNPCGHAAIYVGQNSQGIQVWDQWVGHPVSQRTLRFGSGGMHASSNDGDYFYVIN